MKARGALEGVDGVQDHGKKKRTAEEGTSGALLVIVGGVG